MATVVAGKYELLEVLSDAGIRSYRARQVTLGHVLMVHFIPSSQRGDDFALLDRLAVMVPGPGGWQTLTGDELGAILGDAVLTRLTSGDPISELGGRPPVVGTTVVSGSLLRRLAAAAGVWLSLPMLPVAIEIAAITALAAYVLRQGSRRRVLRAASRVPFGAFLAPAIWFGWVLDTMLSTLNY